MDSALVWFRRDLRLTDHAALHHALNSARRIVCAFVFDREILDPLRDGGTPADRRVEFILDAVEGLDAGLRVHGGTLVVRHGRAAVEIVRLAAEVAEFSRRHRAAETAAKAAWAAAGVVAKAQRRYHAPFKHDRGVWIGPDGMEGRGAAFTNEVRSAAVRVCLDHTFVSDALAAVALFSPSGTAVVQATDAQSAVVFGKGAEAGERVVVVMMPLAVDD